MAHEAKACGALGVYKPRRLQASPLFRLVQDHCHRLETESPRVFRRARYVSAPRAA